MNKLYTKNAAIKYLRGIIGSMSLKTFDTEVSAGRIPMKPYGNTVRFRQEDLDTWLNLTITFRSDYTKEGTSGTHTSRSMLLDGDLSFENLPGAKTSSRRKLGV